MAETKPVSPIVAEARARIKAQAAAREAEPAAPMAGGKPTTLPTPPRGRVGLDLATILGLGAGLALVAAALAMGGDLRAFVDVPSILIVLGGTPAVTLVSFAGGDIRAALGLMRRAFTTSIPSPAATARFALQVADTARRHGPVSLQALAQKAGHDPLLRRMLDLVVDGVPADEAERILRTEIEADQGRARAGAAVLRRAAEVAPAMGLIGTLVGLVQMLGNLSNPSSIGPAMAVALLTTFYGAILGSMVLSPLAGKVERNADARALVDTLYLLTAGSIARQENPRRLETLMNTVLPPEHRQSTFD